MFSYISSLIGHEPIHHSVFLSHRSVEILADRCDLDDMPMRSPSFAPAITREPDFLVLSRSLERLSTRWAGPVCLAVHRVNGPCP